LTRKQNIIAQRPFKMATWCCLPVFLSICPIRLSVRLPGCG